RYVAVSGPARLLNLITRSAPRTSPTSTKMPTLSSVRGLLISKIVFLQIGDAIDELMDHRVLRTENLFRRAIHVYLAVAHVKNAFAHPPHAARVVRDHNRRDVQPLYH